MSSFADRLPEGQQRVFGDAIRRLEKTRVQTDPFPHLVLDDVMDDFFLRLTDRFWPDPSLMGVTNYFPRGEYPVRKLHDDAEGDEKRLWMIIRRFMIYLMQISRQKLSRYFHEKHRALFGVDWRRKLKGMPYLEGDVMIAHYTGAINLPIHVDHSRLLVNSFLYLDDGPGTTKDPIRGTMLYKSQGFGWPTNDPIPKPLREKYLTEAKEIKWKNNRYLSYLNGPYSFHSVPSHDLGEGRRRILMCGTVLSPEMVKLQQAYGER